VSPDSWELIPHLVNGAPIFAVLRSTEYLGASNNAVVIAEARVAPVSPDSWELIPHLVNGAPIFAHGWFLATANARRIGNQRIRIHAGNPRLTLHQIAIRGESTARISQFLVRNAFAHFIIFTSRTTPASIIAITVIGTAACGTLRNGPATFPILLLLTGSQSGRAAI
jgi:hypothetical protein